MDHQKDPSVSEEEIQAVDASGNGVNGYGKRKYGRMVRMFREGYLSVAIYKNAFEKKTFYDVVIYRKVRVRGGGYDYRRGANLKPSDIPTLQILLTEVNDYLEALGQDDIE